MVGGHLYLDVTGFEKIPFKIDAVIAECRFGLGLGRLEGPAEFFGAVDDPHAPAPAARGCLDDHGIADLCRSVACLLLALELAGASRCDRQTSAGDDFPRLGLVAHESDVLRSGANEFNADGFADLGKVRVLGKKAVARMDSV